ncbi:hypothetical protein [uncultured Campylobacter sp.]|uniref:hypothetical protein n=1 Tax=uncultured Campylobacter sp. TaxID=218934 RepID=UPI00262D5F69|nr:hypothetical protein [uncultured Campylobacter sp.]
MDKFSSYDKKDIGLSVYDEENEISLFKVKELMLFREDAKSNAGYSDPETAAEEFLEFMNICYYEIIEAEFIQKHKSDPVWLRVKILQEGKRKKRKKRIDDQCIQINSKNSQIGNRNIQNNKN